MLKTLAALSLIGQLVHPAATTITVSTAAQLSAALSAAKAGDTIVLADGDYSGQFVATRPGTASAPITLDSTIDVKGDDYTITGNKVMNGYLDGIQTHNVWEKTGCGNRFTNNTFTVTNAAGWGINSTNQSDCVSRKKPNVIGASNTATGGKGVSKTPVTPGS